MGIRFLCHHCEKRLNVKSVQAGKPGQCPHCLGKVLVPRESTIPSELEKQLHVRRGKQRAIAADESSIGLHDVDEQITMNGIPAEDRHQQSSAGTGGMSESPPLFDSDVGEQSVELFMLDKPQLPATMGKIDPIAEAPTQVWYFRSRELGERGPLKAKAMQEHIDQGDVKVGSVVWRDDWNDWIPAEKAFPSLVAEAKSKRRIARVARAFKEANYAMPAGSGSETEMNKRNRRKKSIFISAVASGVFIIVVLLVVLLKLVANNP